MPIGLSCPQCGHLVYAPAKSAGKMAACPVCQRSIAVPATGMSADPASAVVTLPCPNCHSPLQLVQELHGRRVRCNQCQAMLSVSADPWLLTIIDHARSDAKPAVPPDAAPLVAQPIAHDPAIVEPARAKPAAARPAPPRETPRNDHPDRAPWAQPAEDALRWADVVTSETHPADPPAHTGDSLRRLIMILLAVGCGWLLGAITVALVGYLTFSIWGKHLLPN